jgi:CO/xanthine dehydrogenase Mo-binding subunit
VTTTTAAPAEFVLIGKGAPRIDAPRKVRGSAEYVADIRRPRMLFGAVLRSPWAHARIRSIDASAALALEGVHAVITSDDTPKQPWGVLRRDTYALAVDRVRFVGEEVAAVAAVDLRTAREALKLIAVEYEELPPVSSVDEALAPDAPLVHADAPGNVAYAFRTDEGDVDGGFARSDVIVEGTWETGRQWHAALETIGAVAEWDDDGRVTLWCNTQTPFLARQRYAVPLGIAERDVRVVQTEIGGGFGGKSADDNCALICAFLAKKTGRPVKLINTREDEFLGSRPRMPIRYHVKLGFSQDGIVRAKAIRVVADNGAYTGKSMAVASTASVRHDALYKYPATRSETQLVYTNLTPTGAFRGFGSVQSDWAVEQAWDMAAQRLGIDIVDLLRLNAAEPGFVSTHDHKITSCELRYCIDRAAELIGWREKRAQRRPNRGLGIACSVHVNGRRSFGDWDGSCAIVRVNEDGRATIITGEGEIGQGARTTFALIAAEALGFPLRDVDVTPADTALAPHALGALGSRVTYVAGNAIRRAAGEAKRQILAAAAEQLGRGAAELDVRDGWIVAAGAASALPGLLPVAAAVRAAIYRPDGTPIVAVASFDNPSVHPDEVKFGNESGAYNFIAAACEVEVDCETGKVDVLQIVAVVDGGTIINPPMAEGQIRGAVAQGYGLALTEGYRITDGKPDALNFGDYKLPACGDMPPLTVEFAPSYEPTGPFGAKGIGEIALDPIPAIIANAVADAVGVRIHTTPVTAEKVYRALRARAAGRA